MYTAHLIVWLRYTEKSPLPIVGNVGIYSSGPMSLTHAPHLGTPAELFAIGSAESFQKAHDAMVETVKNLPHLKWVVPWIENTFENWCLVCTMTGQINEAFPQ